MILPPGGLGEPAECDVCIVGTGPAGLAVALKAAKRFPRVLLLEGGTDSWTEASQDLYRGTVVGSVYHPLDTTRLRMLGGTSNHWTGRCRPLTEADFGPRDHVALSGWPIGRADLAPWLDEARAVLDIPPFPPDRPLASGLQAVDFRRSSMRVAEKYREWFDTHPRITVALGANVVHIHGDGARVTAIEAIGDDGTRTSVRARAFVLATGGIENSRLLLWNNKRTNEAIVRDATTLGRYWMEHPHHYIGDAIIEGTPSFTMAQDEAGEVLLERTPTAMLEDRTLNCGMRFVPISYRDTKKVIADLACVAPDIARTAAALLDMDLYCGVRIRAAWEQAPHPDNRIVLGDETDRFGMPRVELRLRWRDEDVAPARAVALRFGRYLAETGTGRLHIAAWVLDGGPFPADIPGGGHHHMGGTRMAVRPSEGVVDRDCRVFGQENLFIAGSSVFPTAGYVNPTFTIVQLALRLGEHLAAVF